MLRGSDTILLPRLAFMNGNCLQAKAFVFSRKKHEAKSITCFEYVCAGDGNIVLSIDISGKKEYNYEYFIKNLQGDVIAIVDEDAKTVARYSYDAWGVCTVILDSAGIANINPFRYRGYYYDEDNVVILPKILLYR